MVRVHTLQLLYRPQGLVQGLTILSLKHKRDGLGALVTACSHGSDWCLIFPRCWSVLPLMRTDVTFASYTHTERAVQQPKPRADGLTLPEDDVLLEDIVHRPP